MKNSKILDKVYKEGSSFSSPMDFRRDELDKGNENSIEDVVINTFANFYDDDFGEDVLSRSYSMNTLHTRVFAGMLAKHYGMGIEVENAGGFYRLGPFGGYNVNLGEVAEYIRKNSE